MVKKDIPTLKINKLTQEQYNEALANNMIDEDSIYLTPTTVKDYALKSDLNNKADLINGKIPMKQIPDEIIDVNLTNYYTKSEIDDSLSKKVELIDGKISENLIPKEIQNHTVPWEKIDNKPFYEKGTKITWDGETTDLRISFNDSIDISWDGTLNGDELSFSAPPEAGLPDGAVVYLKRMSEKVENLIGLKMTVNFGNGDSEYDINQTSSVYDDNGNLIAEYQENMWVWNVKNPGTVPIMGIDVTFSDTGLYFICIPDVLYVSSLYEETDGSALTWCRIREPLKGTITGYRMNITIEGQDLELIFDNKDEDEHFPPTILNSGSSVTPYVFNVVKDNERIPITGIGDDIYLNVPKAGLYFLDFKTFDDQSNIIFNYLVSSDYEIIKLDEKFLPENILSGGSSLSNYSGQFAKVEDNEGIDAVVLNYNKATSLSNTINNINELYDMMTYGVVKDKEFLLTINALNNGSDTIETKFENIRIGLCDTVGDDGLNIETITYTTVIELVKIKTLSQNNSIYQTYRCYQNPKYPNLYIGFLVDGIYNKVQANIGIPVSSDGVYEYLNSMGLNPEELEDTKIKANTQANWAENDTKSISYIRNRLVYDESVYPDIKQLTLPPIHAESDEVIFNSQTCTFREMSSASGNALEIVNNISELVLNDGASYGSKSFSIEGDSNIASIKIKVYDSATPVLIIKTIYGSYSIDGINFPVSSGYYSICNENTNFWVREIKFKTRPHQLPAKYIPTDDEAIKDSSNLISSGAVYNALSSIENNLKFDEQPTLNSEKLVKSGGIAAALDKKVDITSFNTSNEAIVAEINKKVNQSNFNNLTTEVSKKVNQSDFNNLTTEVNKKADLNNVYSKTEIDGIISGVFHYKGSVEIFEDLPVSAEVGDVYNIKTANTENNIKAGDNVVRCEIDGIGYWDVLSGIVDLSAYSTSQEIQGKLDEVQDQLQNQLDEKANKIDLNNYLTSTEVQIELGKKANKNEIPSLEGVAMETDLAEVALSNDYLDLDNRPFYTMGIDQTITYNGSYDIYTVSKYPPYYYTKCGEYLASKTVQEYIDGFDSLVYKKVIYNSTNVDMNQAWKKQSNGIVAFKNQCQRNGAFVVIVPEDNLVYDLESSTTSEITFKTKGIYCLLDEGDKSAFTSRVIFKTTNIPLDKKYLPKATDNALGGVIIGDSLNIDDKGKLNYTLPVATTDILGGVKVGDNLSISEDGTISATSLDWNNVDGKPELYTKDEVYTKSEVNVIKSNLETSINTAKTTLTNSINTKVNKVEGSRLMTNAEGTKLDGIEENANNYTLPAATTSSLGGVKVGANLSVTEDGTISATSLSWNNVKDKPELYAKNEVDVIKSNLETSIDTKQDKSNLVTNISSSSTDTQYPSAKSVYSALGKINSYTTNYGTTGYTTLQYRGTALYPISDIDSANPGLNGTLYWFYE